MMAAGETLLDKHSLPQFNTYPLQPEAGREKLLAIQEQLRSKDFETLIALCQQLDADQISALLARAERLFPPENGPYNQAVQDAKYTYVTNELIALGATLLARHERRLLDAQFGPETAAGWRPAAWVDDELV